jgi:Molybdopterin-binding domain of aldehyde dehydrogenase
LPQLPSRKNLPEDLQGPLAGISDQTLPVASFPYGTQVCEVEVDPDTGEVEIMRYTAVDDVGRAINPLVLHGQTHGGIAQGVGQALLENNYYDPQSGRLLAASFMDYAMPRADTLPLLTTALSEVPAPSNRLGVRSGGEGERHHRSLRSSALSSTPSPTWEFATLKCRRHLSESGVPCVRLPQDEGEGAEHPKVLAAQSRHRARWGAQWSGPEHTSRSYRPLAQTSALVAVQPQGNTEANPGPRDCRSRHGRFFRDEPRLSNAAQADGSVCPHPRRS